MTVSEASIGRPAMRHRGPTWGRVAFVVHSATGLWLTLVLLLVMVSGTLTVLTWEIDWLLYPEMRVAPSEARVNAGALYDAVRAVYPEAGINSLETGAYRERLAANALVTLPEGGVAHVWVDQWTGEVTGRTPFLTPGQFIDRLHQTLFLPVIGRAAVNVFGVLTLVSIVTGLIVYKKFWRGFLRRPRFHRGARTWLGDLHRLVALWSLWFAILIGVTGTWWFYDVPLVDMAGAPPIAAEAPPAPALSTAELDRLGPETPSPLPAAELVARVAARWPEMVVTAMIPPRNATEPFRVFGDRGAALTERGGDVVHLNPYTGEIMGARLVEDWKAIQRVDEAMHPLHYGSWGKQGAADLGVKAVWAAGGAALSFLAASGLLIYIKRTRTAFRAVGGSAALVRVWRWVRPWGGPMGALKYVNIAVIAGVSAGGALVLSLAASGAGGNGVSYPPRQAGPFTVSATALAGVLEAGLDPLRPGARAEVYVEFAEGRHRDARRIWAAVGTAPPTATSGALVEGPKGLARARIGLPERLGPELALWIIVEGWDGRRHRTHWPLLGGRDSRKEHSP